LQFYLSNRYLIRACGRQGRNQRALRTSPEFLENFTEKSLQIFTLEMAEIDRVVHGMSSPTQKLDLPPSIHCGREDDLLKKVPAHMMGATEGEKKAPSF
jgi:hypothetical protein